MKTLGGNREYARVIALGQVAALAATAWFVWSVWRHAPWRVILNTLSTAIGVSTLAWVASAIVTFYVLLIFSSDDVSRIRWDAVRRSSVGIWFAPAMVLLSILSPLALAASLILSMNTARLLARQCFRRGRPREIAPGLFGSFDPAFLRWRSAPALSGGFAILAGAIALLYHRPLITAILFVASAAIVTALNVKDGPVDSKRTVAAPPSSMSMVLTVLLAMLLSAGGIELGRGLGGDDGSSSAPAERTVTKVYVPPSGREFGIRGDDFPGVILRPDPPPKQALAIPRLYSVGEVKTDSMLLFSGEYWMFREPQRQPPPDSYVSNSSPLDRHYYTVDHWPMHMQAVQSLESPLEVTCCSAIRVWIRNAELMPAMLELRLIDSSTNERASLGRAAAFGEVLTFPVAAGTLRRFDTIKVDFWRDLSQSYKSAKIAIERFEFVPR